MKVILLKDTAKLGKRGEVKEVADTYAINVLLRKGDAVQATSGELAKWKAKEDAKVRQKETSLNTFYSLVTALQSTTVTVKEKKHDDKGQLFANVRESDVVDAIFQAVRLSVDPKQIVILKPIKSVGVHIVEMKQGDKTAEIKVEVL
ncbi:MAG: 50S ribosomal protein L9 [Candidatus Pacebacteria bacterium]|jgi:large subunit ribosomal protein L9|nr:50S ribosomal protein L9 [Candidatus Paceibacterota bacterium]